MNINLIKKHYKIFALATALYNCFNIHNRIKVYNSNKFNKQLVLLKNVKADVKGANNQITIKDFSRLTNCRIYIRGNNNRITIDSKCLLRNVEFYIEDDNNTIFIGEHTSVSGNTHLAAIEGTSIIIGEDCMFSGDIHFRTGDSHSVLDLGGNRINPSQDIKIGNHVWIGTKVTCLKNTEIADNCIVAATSTVCGKHLKPNCTIGGVPAKVIKENINWCRERI